MSDMVKYRDVSFKKDQIAALYFTLSDIVHYRLLQPIWLCMTFRGSYFTLLTRTPLQINQQSFQWLPPYLLNSDNII